MSNFTTDLMSALIRGEGVEAIMRDELEAAMNELLKLELTTFLDYEKPVPHMAIQRRKGELNKRARSTHTSRRSAQTTRNCCQQYWSGYSIRAVASHENRIVRMMGWAG